MVRIGTDHTLIIAFVASSNLLPLLFMIPVVVTIVGITVVFVVPFVFVASIAAPWSEYQRAGLKIKRSCTKINDWR